MASPTIQVSPSSVALAKGDVVELSIILHNPSAVAMTVVGVHIAAAPPTAGSVRSGVLPVNVPARSSTSVPLEISAVEVLTATEIGVVASIRPTSDEVGTRMVSGTLKVTPATEPVAPEATFVVFPDKLNDGDDRRATVRLVNSGAATYTDVVVRAVDSDDVSLRPATETLPASVRCPRSTPGGTETALACLDELGPGVAVLLDMNVRADESVRTGMQEVAVVVSGTRELASGASTLLPVAAIASHEVTLAVFGVDVISPFGIGTLFVLPGLLAVVVFVALAAVYPNTRSLPDTIALTDLRAMPIVVALSALAYGVYWVLWGEDLTREVSTAAVAWLFLFGLLVGALAWGLVALAYRRLVGRKRFKTDDDCATVLDRLQIRNARLALPKFQSNGLRYLYLAPSPNGGVFGAPPIAYSFTSAGQGEDGRAQRAAFYRALEGDGDILTVLAARKAGTVSFNWTNPTGVRTFDASEVDVRGEGSLLEPGRDVPGAD